jgi:hypothetical protein
MELYNSRSFELSDRLILEVGKQQDFGKIIFGRILNGKDYSEVGTIGDLRFMEYDKKMDKFFSYLLSMNINSGYKRKGIAYETIAGLVGVIKENYKFSQGLKIDDIITSDGQKAFFKIAKHLKEDNIVSGYDFVKNKFVKYVFLDF